MVQTALVFSHWFPRVIIWYVFEGINWVRMSLWGITFYNPKPISSLMMTVQKYGFCNMGNRSHRRVESHIMSSNLILRSFVDNHFPAGQRIKSQTQFYKHSGRVASSRIPQPESFSSIPTTLSKALDEEWMVENSDTDEPINDRQFRNIQCVIHKNTSLRWNFVWKSIQNVRMKVK